MSLATNASDVGELIDENLQAISQLIQLVNRLSADQYQRGFGLQDQHTVGKHVRHIIDHYQALLSGIDAALINYEHRQREEALETQPDAARRRLLTVCDFLGQLRDNDHRSPVSIDYPTGTQSFTINSSVDRELVFLSSHTIHHMAIIGLLAEQLGMQPGATFGVHPSTLRHWQRQAADVRATA